jgi:hypothetical protein
MKDINHFIEFDELVKFVEHLEQQMNEIILSYFHDKGGKKVLKKNWKAFQELFYVYCIIIMGGQRSQVSLLSSLRAIKISQIQQLRL